MIIIDGGEGCNETELSIWGGALIPEFLEE